MSLEGKRIASSSKELPMCDLKISCAHCGHHLKIYAYEQGGFVVECENCSVKAIVKANTPQEAAYKSLAFEVKKPDDMNLCTAVFWDETPIVEEPCYVGSVADQNFPENIVCGMTLPVPGTDQPVSRNNTDYSDQRQPKDNEPELDAVLFALCRHVTDIMNGFTPYPARMIASSCGLSLAQTRKRLRALKEQGYVYTFSYRDPDSEYPPLNGWGITEKSESTPEYEKAAREEARICAKCFGGSEESYLKSLMGSEEAYRKKFMT